MLTLAGRITTVVPLGLFATLPLLALEVTRQLNAASSVRIAALVGAMLGAGVGIYPDLLGSWRGRRG